MKGDMDSLVKVQSISTKDRYYLGILVKKYKKNQAVGVLIVIAIFFIVSLFVW